MHASPSVSQLATRIITPRTTSSRRKMRCLVGALPSHCWDCHCSASRERMQHEVSSLVPAAVGQVRSSPSCADYRGRHPALRLAIARPCSDARRWRRLERRHEVSVRMWRYDRTHDPEGGSSALGYQCQRGRLPDAASVRVAEDRVSFAFLDSWRAIALVRVGAACNRLKQLGFVVAAD